MGVLLVGTSAYAQSSGASITSVVSSAETRILPGPGNEGSNFFGSTSLGYGAGHDNFPTSGVSDPSGRAQWNSFVDQNPDGTITFESSNALSGPLIATASSSVVQLGIQNGGSLDLHSTITAAGMGFYVANVGDGSCIETGTCAQVSSLSSYDFADFAAADSNFLAQVGFTFDVVASASSFDDSTLYSVMGSLQLNADGSLVIFENTEDAFLKLKDFGLQTPPAGGAIPYHSLGYNWHETGFDVSAGLFDTGFQTVTYRTSVFSLSRSSCLSGRGGVDTGVTACLIAYSGFGDPIGRGVSGFSSAFDFETYNHADGDGIEGLNFTSFTIDAPRISGNTLVIGGTVPEPATWAMMILGMGGIGATLRRRRLLGVHA